MILGRKNLKIKNKISSPETKHLTNGSQSSNTFLVRICICHLKEIWINWNNFNLLANWVWSIKWKLSSQSWDRCPSSKMSNFNSTTLGRIRFPIFLIQSKRHLCSCIFIIWQIHHIFSSTDPKFIPHHLCKKRS